MKAQLARLEMANAAALAKAPKEPKKAKEPKAPKEPKEPKEGRIVTKTGVANWALMKARTPIKVEAKGSVWTGVFVTSTCFRVTHKDGTPCTPVDFPSLAAMLKAHHAPLIAAGHFKADGNAWAKVKYKSDTDGWMPFDAIRKMVSKTPPQVSEGALANMGCTGGHMPEHALR